MRRSLLSALELSSEAPLFVCPWFVRRGGVHIEHGHVYDPDNAPLHPLAPWSPLTEPLGVALTRRFLVPCGALSLVHAHETTPLAGLARVMRLFGHRGPLVVARYFGVAAALCWQSLGQRGGFDPLQDELAVETFARDADVDLDCVRALLRSLPAATHRRFIRTFRRLYLDRACATAAALGAVAVSVTTGGAAPVAGALVAAGYLGASCLGEGTSRYAGRLEVRLRTAARSIGLITGSRLVILGHSHHGDSAPGYANPGSFGYPDANVPRYILVDIDGNASCLEALTRCTRFALTPSR
jgi:hypothetical protein